MEESCLIEEQLFVLLGGRGSTASQRAHGELAPNYAAGKVPVPWGRECQQETAGPEACRAW